ncbi:hypothetical protein EJB05_31352, partial [Eragrostis curvula]
MGTDRSNDDDGRHGGGAGADRISGLPDHLLHTVLLRLPGTADAARTSVLSRRWRRVWTHVPDLVLRYIREPVLSPSRVLIVDRIDAALAAHAAATINRLEIAMPLGSRDFPAGRVSAWLRVASQRRAREIRISLPAHRVKDEKDIMLPQCERAAYIGFDLKKRTLRFTRPHQRVRRADHHEDARELEEILSCRCPCLKDLVLKGVTIQNEGPVVSLRSRSLERLEIHIDMDGRLNVDAPKLQVFYPCLICDFCIVAPKLSVLRWYNLFYDPSRHNLADAGKHLRRLKIDASSPGSALMQRFNTVQELDLTINIAKDDNLCEFSLECPCHWRESSKAQKVMLGSLEEVEISDYGDVDYKLDLVRLLWRCSTTFQKKVVITISEGRRREYTMKKILSICPPNDKVEVNIVPPASRSFGTSTGTSSYLRQYQTLGQIIPNSCSYYTIENCLFKP